MIGERVGGVTLVAEAEIPEPGWWFRSDGYSEGQPIWVRVPRPDVFDDPVAISVAWERLQHLSHALVPRPVGFDEQTGAMLVAAPVAVPLGKFLAARKASNLVVTPATVLELGRSLADLVVHAHEGGRPHGHLSPDNVLLAEDGRIVVWGFASGPDAGCSARWEAPERARGHRAGGDADQWAIAAILAAMVTGRVPWRGEDPHSEARVGDAAHLHDPVMTQWAPLGRVLRRSLAADPRDRFPSSHPLRQALEALRQRAPQRSGLPELGAWLVASFGPEDPVSPPPLVAEHDVRDEGADVADQVAAPEQEGDPAERGAPVFESGSVEEDPVRDPRGSEALPPLGPLTEPPRVPTATGGLHEVRIQLPLQEPGAATTPTQVPDERDEADLAGAKVREPVGDPEATQPLRAMSAQVVTEAPRNAEPVAAAEEPAAEEVFWEDEEFDEDDEAGPEAAEPPSPLHSSTIEMPEVGGWSIGALDLPEETVPDASIPGIGFAARREPIAPEAPWERWAVPVARVLVPIGGITFVLRWIVPWWMG